MKTRSSPKMKISFLLTERDQRVSQTNICDTTFVGLWKLKSYWRKLWFDGVYREENCSRFTARETFRLYLYSQFTHAYRITHLFMLSSILCMNAMLILSFHSRFSFARCLSVVERMRITLNVIKMWIMKGIRKA